MDLSALFISIEDLERIASKLKPGCVFTVKLISISSCIEAAYFYQTVSSLVLVYRSVIFQVIPIPIKALFAELENPSYHLPDTTASSPIPVPRLA